MIPPAAFLLQLPGAGPPGSGAGASALSVPPVLPWMVYAVVVGLLLAGAAWCLERAAGGLRLPTRWIWAATLLLSVGVPVGIGWSQVQGTAFPESTSQPLRTGPEDPVPGHGTGLAALLPDATRPLLLVFREASQAVAAGLRGAEAVLPARPAVERAVLALWFTTTLTLGAILAFSGSGLARRRARWPRRTLRGRLVRISPGFGPAAVGVFRSEIVVPRWVEALDALDQELLLVHESEHVRARDPLLLAGGVLLAVLLPWNPATWWQFRRLRDAVEIDCDRRTLRNGARSDRYGELLLRIGSRPRSLTLPSPALQGPPTLLRRRLLLMKGRTRRASVSLTALAGVAAVSLLLLACDAAPPTGESGRDALPVEAGATLTPDAHEGAEPTAVLLRTIAGEPLVIVDGVIVADLEALGLDPSGIESIEVIRGVAAEAQYGSRAAAGVVVVRTHHGAPPEVR